MAGALLAFPLGRVLYCEHFLVLVLLRRTNLVSFLGGAATANDRVPRRSSGHWPHQCRSSPCRCTTTWKDSSLREPDKHDAPFLAARLAPSDRVEQVRNVLKKRVPASSSAAALPYSAPACWT